MKFKLKFHLNMKLTAIQYNLKDQWKQNNNLILIIVSLWKWNFEFLVCKIQQLNNLTKNNIEHSFRFCKHVKGPDFYFINNIYKKSEMILAKDSTILSNTLKCRLNEIKMRVWGWKSLLFPYYIWLALLVFKHSTLSMFNQNWAFVETYNIISYYYRSFHCKHIINSITFNMVNTYLLEVFPFGALGCKFCNIVFHQDFVVENCKKLNGHNFAEKSFS